MADTAQVTLAGSLKTSGGTAIAGATITFTDSNGDTIAPATTDTAGNFTTTVTVPVPAANPETFNASYAGSATDKPATASATATILAGTALTLTVTVA